MPAVAPVPLGFTEQPEIIDAPGHAVNLARYRARGYRMAGNRIRLVTDHPEGLVDVHSPSFGSVDLGGLTVERGPLVPAGGERDRDQKSRYEDFRGLTSSTTIR